MNTYQEELDDRQKGTETLRREIGETRAKMGRTLDALGQKLSPTRLRGEFATLIRGNGSRWASDLSKAVERKPVTIMLLLALGVIGMAFSRVRPALQSVIDGDRIRSMARAFAREGREEFRATLKDRRVVFGALGGALGIGIGAILLRAAWRRV
jgi:hypothetical protein